MSLGSTFAQNASLAACYGDDAAYSAGWPFLFFVELYVGDPADGGVAMSGGGYGPVVMANTTAALGGPLGGALGPITVTWPSSTGAWSGGTPPDHAAFLDGSGNLLDVGVISANPGITDTGQIFELDVTITAA